MSNNKDLAKQLEAMRHKAKEAAAAEPSSEPTAPPPTQPSSPPKLKVVASRKPKPTKPKMVGQGRPVATIPTAPELNRTTITLKTGDNAALSELQTFLIQRVRKAPSTSTLIRLALLYTKQSLASDAEALAQVYAQILKEDGRRKAVKV